MKYGEYNLSIRKNTEESSNFTKLVSQNSLDTITDYHFNESYFCHLNDCSILAQELDDRGKVNKYYFKIAHSDSVKKIIETREIIEEKLGKRLSLLPGSIGFSK